MKCPMKFNMEYKKATASIESQKKRAKVLRRIMFDKGLKEILK